MLLLYANDLLYEKALSNMVRLMGSLPWGPMLNLRIQSWLFIESWPLLRNLLLLLQVIVNSLGRSGLGHLGVQSYQIFVLQILTKSLMRHNSNFLKTSSYILATNTWPFPLVTIFGWRGWSYAFVCVSFFLFVLLLYKNVACNGHKNHAITCVVRAY
jgi:hypothetical protein